MEKIEELSLKLLPREVTGKKVKRLRRAGVVPVHFYGVGTSPLSLQVELAVLRRVLPRAGANIPINVEVEGQKGENICFVREIQRHPVTEDLLHVDFMRVDVSKEITAEVPILLEGEPPAVQDFGGTLLQPLNTVSVQALPMMMPASFSLDVSGLDDFEKTLRVSDLMAVEGATIMADPEDMVATVVPPRIEEEPEVEEEEELELAEGEEAPEGEEPAEEEAAER